MKYLSSHIAKVIDAHLQLNEDVTIDVLLVDSRKLQTPASSLFFALTTSRRNGHQFIPELYNKGVRNFVVSEEGNFSKYPEANFLIVADTLVALQQLAAHHRSQFKQLPVIGITGSNGKTIVKEWLYQLLHNDFNIVRSPKSYNSQIGVPLSVWQMNERHTLAIFEAGISQPGEMDKLEKIIQPTIGVLTNIGEAHSEGFITLKEKETEKRKLFINAVEPTNVQVVSIQKKQTATTIDVLLQTGERASIAIPFTDDASIQNAITCWKVLLHFGIKEEVIKQRMLLLQPINMRLEFKKGINNCTIINDSYSADTSSLEIALNFLVQQSPVGKRTVILSDFMQTSLEATTLYAEITQKLKGYSVNRLIGVGENIIKAFATAKTDSLPFEVFLYQSTEELLQQFRRSWFKDETILVKGARIFAFEKIVQSLELKAHQTVLEINLTAIVHNLKEYQKSLKPSTKIMAMVKAFAYGSGSAEVAGILQYHKADYLGVAYADEGVELRKAGISLPIMVLNPEESAFETITEYNLEPELYSFEMLQAFEQFVISQGLESYPVHIEFETGMNRLGFLAADAEKLGKHFATSSILKIQSAFSHLAASEDKAEDEFTLQQFETFNTGVGVLRENIPYSFLTHIANSAAAIRHPQLQLDMVRLGIGLYGVDSAITNFLNLQTVATLKSTVAQIKYLKKGDTVSYNRRGIVEKNTVIATIRLGYADGYSRRLGNGKAYVLINNKPAPIIGTVCMDMFMADVTAIENVKEGDDVILFGEALPVQQVARWADTIPYEIMTGISQRVKRVYYEE